MKTFADNLSFPECPRWHADALWVSDMWSHRVLRFDSEGGIDAVVELDGDDPGGLGWLPDGRMLVVGMESRKIWRVERDDVVVHADLTSFADFPLNDMVVDSQGVAYVTQFGYDIWGGTPAETVILRVDPHGTATVAAEGMAVPNGIAVNADESSLVVAEPGAGRLSTFSLTPSGLQDRVLHPVSPADGMPYVGPDGLCLDSGGGVWVADPMARRVIHLREGRTEREIAFPDCHPTACVLGGHDRRTLFVTAAEEVSKAHRTLGETGRIIAIAVETPGAGRP